MVRAGATRLPCTDGRYAHWTCTPAENVKGLDNAELKKLIVPYRLPRSVWNKSFYRITGDELSLLTKDELEKYAGADGVNIYNLLHANPAPGTLWCHRRVVLLGGLMAHVSMSDCAAL